MESVLFLREIILFSIGTVQVSGNLGMIQGTSWNFRFPQSARERNWKIKIKMVRREYPEIWSTILCCYRKKVCKASQKNKRKGFYQLLALSWANLELLRAISTNPFYNLFQKSIKFASKCIKYILRIVKLPGNITTNVVSVWYHLLRKSFYYSFSNCRNTP